MVRQVLGLVYRRMLAKKWKMGSGAGMLAGHFIADYKARRHSLWKIRHIHRLGFSVGDWDLLSLTDENCGRYLSTARYYAMHPLNGEFSKWIDDKLTLKYLCCGTELDRYCPAYYYQIDSRKNVLPLPDAEGRGGSADIGSIVDLLESKGVLALKRIAGSLGEGFYRLERDGGSFLVNGKRMSRAELEDLLGGLKSYIVTEFLEPHPDLAAFCPGTANTIRYLWGRGTTYCGDKKVSDTTCSVRGLCSFVRFGTLRSGMVENYNSGGILCYLDEKGRFVQGHCIETKTGKDTVILNHPGNGRRLQGEIPLWDEILKAVSLFAAHFPQLDYLGFDFVVTEDSKVKLLEVNSLTSLNAIQLERGVFESDVAGFYTSRLK